MSTLTRGDDVTDLTEAGSSAAPPSASNGAAASSIKASKPTNIGRKPDRVREHFTSTGQKDSNCRRCPCKCNYCSAQFTASSAKIDTLTEHIHFKCDKVPPSVKQSLLQQQAVKQVNSTAGEAAVEQGVKRKAAPGGAATSAKQRSIGHYLPGSKENALTPDEKQQIDEHMLRFFVTSNVSFNAVDNPHLHAALKTLHPGYTLPGPTKLRTTLLAKEYAACMAKLYENLLSAENLTLTVDGWTDYLGRSILGVQSWASSRPS